MPNRLVLATSQYLLQHARDPVDWWPWGDEAFEEARRRDVPVLLSVGYSACHWCHVMAHESFADPATAALVNERFVAVKVDREERPDVDALYMEALVAMTGQGGWPMTLFLTPQRRPFFAGTYFPPQPRHGAPSFGVVLDGVHDAWISRRAEVDRVAEAYVTGAAKRAESLRLGLAGQATGALDEAGLAAAAADCVAAADPAHGGFGGAPKFPHPMVLDFLLRHAARTGSSAALATAEHALRAMAYGGIYDQLDGGFARYSVDAAWGVPHFEKMLDDNALLLRVYGQWWRLTGDRLAERIVRETGAWLRKRLLTHAHGFAASMDADSDGVEGAYYLWTPGLLRDALGADDGDWAARVFGVTAEGTAGQGRSPLRLAEVPSDTLRWTKVLRRLREVRKRRVVPTRDDKIVTSWNGLAIGAFAEAGAAAPDARWVDVAAGAAEAVLAHNRRADGRLLRSARYGQPGPGLAGLADHADLAEGLLALFGATGDERWVREAGRLLDVVLDRFGDGDGGFYDTPDDAEGLFLRRTEVTDTSSPGGSASAASALLGYATLTGSSRHLAAADAVLARLAPVAAVSPLSSGWALRAMEARVAGPLGVAVVGPADHDDTRRLHRAAVRAPGPGVVVALATTDGAGRVAEPLAEAVPLLADRVAVDGFPTAYVCRDTACELPITDPVRLAARLAGRAAVPAPREPGVAETSAAAAETAGRAAAGHVGPQRAPGVVGHGTPAAPGDATVFAVPPVDVDQRLRTRRPWKTR